MDKRMYVSTAAAGIVVSSWRDVVEAWHYLLTDSEMSWMSIITTRDILPFLKLDDLTIDYSHVLAIMTNPDREILPGKIARNIFTTEWPELVSQITMNIQQDIDQNINLAQYAQHGLRICPEWWGCPEWPIIAKKASSKLELSSHQMNLLIKTPYKLPFYVWERVIRTIHGHTASTLI